MRNVISFLTVLCMLFPLYAYDTQETTSDESQNSSVESENNQEEEAYEEEYEDEDGCVTEDDFIVGNSMYRWYILPSGARVLKCRRIYSNVSVGVHFGPWCVAYNYYCNDFHDGYFTYCPYCQVYYCSHPCHGMHHHHHFYFHNYYNTFSVNHYWQFYFPWKPWFFGAHHCSWIHGPHGWHWNHGKHCWHWHPGHNGQKVYHTQYWKHHGNIRPIANKQVHQVNKVKPVYKVKPVQQGTYIQKAKPVNNATQVKPVNKNNVYITKNNSTPANQNTAAKTAKPVYKPQNNYNKTTVTRPANNAVKTQTPSARPNTNTRPAANGGAAKRANTNNNIRKAQSR